ncbi:hypothetical protein Tco_0120895 [Tanacetum coccineum]
MFWDILNQIEPAQPELAPHVPDPTPLSPNHVFDFLNENPNEDSEEDSEEEPEEEELEEIDMDMDMGVDSDDEMDGPELIFPYKEMDSPNLSPPELDTSSDSESKAAPTVTVGTITQVPRIGRMFLGSTYAIGGPSFAAPIAYHSKDLVPSTMRREIDSLHDFDLAIMERHNDKVEHQVVALEEHVLKLEQDGVREENERRKKKLKSTEVSDTLVRPARGAGGPAGGAGGPAGGAGGLAVAPATRESTFAGFMKCNPSTFSGVESVVGMCRWFKNLEMVFSISECAERNKVKFDATTLQGRALTWQGNAKAMTNAPTEKRGVGHQTRDCRSKAITTGANTQPIVTYTSYEIEIADGKIVSTNTILRGCSLNLVNYLFEIDFMPFKLGTFDVIIIMVWLSKSDAIIVCGEKIIRIPYNNKTLIIEGDRVTKKEPVEKRVEDVPVIRDFPEVFLGDLPGLPQPRKVEFRIELVLGAALVAWKRISKKKTQNEAKRTKPST